MSRREGRESPASNKRSHSRIEREPSPKRSRRDGKPKTERNTSRNYDLDTLHNNDQDQKRPRRLQDALPLEAPVEPESKVGSDITQMELKKKTVGKDANGTEHSSDPTEVPRAPTFFQHDDRGNPGQGGRSFVRRGNPEGGRWTDRKYRGDERSRGNEESRNLHRRDERTQTEDDDNNVWRHDRFHDLEADAPPSTRKRPAFREKKVEQESGTTAGISAMGSGRYSRTKRSLSENARREERGGRRPYPDRIQRPYAGDRAPPLRRETPNIGFSSRERFGGANVFLDRVNGFRRGYGDRNQSNSTHTENWKHDLFDEANKSPSPKNTEDQIATVEALLAL